MSMIFSAKHFLSVAHSTSFVGLYSVLVSVAFIILVVHIFYLIFQPLTSFPGICLLIFVIHNNTYSDRDQACWVNQMVQPLMQEGCRT